MEAFHPQLNAAHGYSMEDLYVSNPARLFFKQPRCQHVELITTQTAERKFGSRARGSQPECNICAQRRRAGVEASAVEQSARRAAQRQLAAAGLDGSCGGIAVECRLLKEKKAERYAAADVVMHFTTLAGRTGFLLIQADGEQHFDQAHCFPGQRVEEQQQRDAAFNAAALQQRFSVARLHYADTEEYDAVLQAALQLVLSGSQPFVMFSRSYGRPLSPNLPATLTHHA